MKDWQSLSDDNFEDMSDEDIAAIADAIYNDAIEQSYTNLMRLRSVMIVTERRRRRKFEQRLAAVYRPALEYFEHFVTTCRDIGSDVNEALRPEAVAENDLVFTVLTRLHVRACLIASEIRSLLNSGHASGALARWRTLHEIVVIAYFIKDHGNEVAEKYLLHHVVRDTKELAKYNEHREALGYEPIEPEVQGSLIRQRDELVKRFGSAYKGDWGWAVGTMPGTPTFTRIEQAIGLSHWRPQFGLASASVHAGYAGTTSDMGLGSLEFTDVMLAGPSDAGLIEAAGSAIIDLLNCTVALIVHKPNPETVVQMMVMQRYMDDCRNAFLEIERRFTSDESDE